MAHVNEILLSSNIQFHVKQNIELRRQRYKTQREKGADLRQSRVWPPVLKINEYTCSKTPLLWIAADSQPQVKWTNILSLSGWFPASGGTSGIVLGTTPAVSEALKSSPALPSLLLLCQENLCQNGGTCHQMYLRGGVTSFRCDCPLHFTGRFCEKDTTLFFPSFSPDSYLELPSLTSLSEDGFPTGQEWSRMTIYLTVKTNALNGTLLYSEYGL
nr:PREDICTED: uncharacterized protein LOC103279860 [Anolis carolinensis]|eukprot:XP_008115094.1 PREDICTED: uncharacterized protein LOC103279860 [Anolis carolinensis]